MLLVNFTAIGIRKVKICILLQVYKIHIEKQIKEIVNRLNKTKQEATPNFQEERENRDRLERNAQKHKLKEEKKKEKEELEKKKKEAELRFDSFFV